MSIFDEKNKIKNNWFKFAKIGDKIEGTLVSKKTINNQLSGGEQNIYELLLDNGEYWNIGGKKAVDVQMARVKLGQIVGFEFTKEIKATKPGMSNTKVIQVYADPKVVNEKWLAEYETAQSMVSQEEEHEGGGVVVEDMFKDSPAEKTILDLAKSKLEGADEQNYKIKVMEKTGLAFIESNYDVIIEKLKTL